ncbi:MAG TPA: diguanylate cyclase [Ardenticatenaceae bacterium]|jgi:diguanylate cyclase (GGDEF)-like protein
MLTTVRRPDKAYDVAGRVPRGRRAAPWLLLGVAVVAAVLFPWLLPVLVLVPLLAVLFALLWMAPASLRMLGVAAWVVTLVVGTLGVANLNLPLSYRALAEVAMAATATFLFLRLWKFHDLFSSIAQTREINGGLEQRLRQESRAVQHLMTQIGHSKTVQKALEMEVQQRGEDLNLLNRLGALAWTESVPQESCAQMADLTRQLFPGCHGVLYLTLPGQEKVQKGPAWGAPATREHLGFNECRGLRAGQSYFVRRGDQEPLCAHLQPTVTAESLCVPLRADDQTLGLLHLSAVTGGYFNAEKQTLAHLAARQMALVLAHLQLRETMQEQSVSDPLTHLYNRQYMEESLKREMRRVSRHQRPLGVIMIDVDNLQGVKEQSGENAADALLRELAALLQSSIRGGDIASRYTDDEFVLVLPDAPYSIIRQRAEQLRQEVCHLQAQQRAQGVCPVTLSIGIATFPDHGVTDKALLKAASAAVARAKQDGGDLVTVA